MVLKSASSIKTCGIMLHFLALFCFFVFQKKYLLKKQHIEIKPKKKKRIQKKRFLFARNVQFEKGKKRRGKKKKKKKTRFAKKG